MTLTISKAEYIIVIDYIKYIAKPDNRIGYFVTDYVILYRNPGEESGMALRNNRIRDFTEFRQWVKHRLIDKELTQVELAERLGTSNPRISEATKGKNGGKKYILPIIKALDGDPDDFKELLKAI